YLKRQLEILYQTYLPYSSNLGRIQRIINLEIYLHKLFLNYRVTLKGKSYGERDLDHLLETETNNSALEKIWKAKHSIGKEAKDSLLCLVKLRNEVAKESGYKNYLEMRLALSDQKTSEVDLLFQEIDSLSRPFFVKSKQHLDQQLSHRYGIAVSDLRPWHYRGKFLQESPNSLYSQNSSRLYKHVSLEKLASCFYAGIGLELDDILMNSDLYEKKEKSQYTHCLSVDRKNDIRLFSSLCSNEASMKNLLYECGHAVYYKNISTSLPYLLRKPTHPLIMEAVAMLFGRFTSNVNWMLDIGLISISQSKEIQDEALRNLRLEQQLFSRRAQVMYRFEKAMYENPNQDLNALWWKLVREYQLQIPPESRENEADWVNIHFALAPCYFQNYLLGEILASQLNHYLCMQILGTDKFSEPPYIGREEVGNYLKRNFFILGSSLTWNEMIEKATGEKLTLKYYVDQFIK
ncbi:MAG: M2 family metallopeptidase, partial [Bacteroidales bacterium]